ncbi:YheC/YheD family endospore coat-associated protein [Peribacillus glennii]|uniref:YheC/YheD family protein n=1 Tax=Peribacillus glennii TaxID=2303991 RepID=A0A372L6S8_9BACI|nr:YheC/YheD family protein [Peribacillus glennii]RFU60468.1 YheC/YheD family protein [Peribacillus glennii]
MSLRNYTEIQILPDHEFPAEGGLILPQQLVNKHMINNYQPIELCYGLKKITLDFKPGKSFMVKESAAQFLALAADGEVFGFHYDGRARRLIIGPLVGILMSSLSKTSEQIFGEMTDFCKEVAEKSRSRGGRAVFFTLEQINEESDNIEGWIYNNQKWSQSVFPTPYCVHNRISSRRQESKVATQMKINLLKQRGVFFYNDKFLDKWEIVQQLKNMQNETVFFPYTRLYKGPDSLYEMAGRYPELYVKPTGGSLGKGIMRIKRYGNSYICQFQKNGETITKKYESIIQLGRMLHARIGSRTYVIQQGIELIKHNGSIIDFRALVQKNMYGKWTITSIVGRRGPEQSIVSNVSTGGTILGLRAALESSDAPWLPVDRIVSVMKNKALKFAELFENGAAGNYAELGIDFAVDRTGRVWVLEINSKPSKAGHSVGNQVKGTRPSVKRLIDFCFYQSGFRQQTRKKPSKT